MTLHRMTCRSALVTCALMLLTAQTGSAQQRTLYQWNGRVDHQVHIVMRGRSVSIRRVGDNERGAGQPRVASVLPRENGRIAVNVRRGRGDVDVIQHPNARNGYTAIVRIRDDRSGADQYQIAVAWRPEGRGQGNGGWGRGDDRDRDRNDRGDWDRDDRDRDRDDRGGWGDRDDRNDRDDRGGWGNPGRGNGTGAGNRVVAHFSGRVDDEVDLRIQGRRATTSNRSGNGTSGVRIDVGGMGLPQRDAAVSIRQREGRGSVTVVQQPNSRNGYTAVIRIRDPQGGFGAYDFDVIW
jgi:hypothetical protein